ncbi:FAD-dependent oxidoreductase [Xylophilus rhododendri]|uniref:FAD-dependent oxidoreductase n=1 Tax=Xylophilus rhododendri TaxID=2697032 RepID=A0A857J9D0_9BURK|nr:FAD-dependent oxidoreductase [Xylophilus rhododendri]QHI99711.1 FAD-dependent oxidoreductase [Xylophilus rhododendri]
MPQEILVLGAGMVGTCAALELRLRGHAVTLVDRRPPGRETSYGNAGIIQREAVEPYAFPREWGAMLSVLLRRGLDVNYHPGALLAALPRLARYWRASAPGRHRRITAQYASLIAHSTSEHQRLVAAADAGDLVRRQGFRFAYRSEAAFDAARGRAKALCEAYGVTSAALGGQSLAQAEPALRQSMAGAIHWHQPWTVSDPGALVERYAALFQRLGGRFTSGDAGSLRPQGAGWRVDSAEGPIEAGHAVVALGPWSGPLTAALGYRFPMILKRGYHRHFTGGEALNLPLLDAERGYVLAPMRQGLRLTTGAEIAHLDAAQTPRQLAGSEAVARELLDLGAPVEATPWAGYRPCMADMKPVIGPAPRHPGLWFDFGHGHQGFTLGPASARLLADQIEGKQAYLDPQPFLPSRF